MIYVTLLSRLTSQLCSPSNLSGQVVEFFAKQVIFGSRQLTIIFRHSLPGHD